MQHFAFSTTSRCSNYLHLKSIRPTVLPTQQLKVANFVPSYLKNGFSQLKNFLYSILILPNLDLTSYWLNRVATSPEAQNTFSVQIRSFINVLSCNFIFSSSLPRLFRHKKFNLIRFSGLPLYLKLLFHFHEKFLNFFVNYEFFSVYQLTLLI
ncbi:hypothetical protein O3M35_005213 [Rhynocoris fuscipes]|uniref:Uncharacterized protein n=1 Tax=Rhynocoris fuscipes TaxID=488301 RepID=A0AAW1DJ86_9HEMI